MPKGLWWIVDIAAFCAYLCMLVIALSNYSALPETIPTHFGVTGAPDAYGAKATFLIFPAVGTILLALLTAAPFFPQLINVPGQRTPGNIRAAIGMMRILKLETMALFAFLAWGMMETAFGRAAGVGYVPLLFVGIVLVTVAIGLYQSTRNEN